MSEFTNKNIWVFIETDEGKAKSVGLELLNPGRMLAEKSGEKLVAVVFGKDNAEVPKAYQIPRGCVHDFVSFLSCFLRLCRDGEILMHQTIPKKRCEEIPVILKECRIGMILDPR